VRWATIIGGTVCGIVGYGGTQHFHWAFGFFFGAGIGALAALTVGLLCKPPTVEQLKAAVSASAAKEAERADPAVAS